MPEFDDLQDLLASLNSGIAAPECHGFLTGFLCISDTIDASVWEYICADLDGAESISPEYRSLLHDMGHCISQQMLSSDLDFRLLQPDDFTPFPDRCAALAQWCQGFLSGLGVAGTINWGGLSETCREMITDFSDISRLDAGSDEDSGDGLEVSLMELHEYVRMGVVYIYAEFAMLKTENDYPGVLH